MSEQAKRVLKTQEEVNINFRVSKVRRDAFKNWCKDNSVTQSGMLISFMDDCLMMGKVFETKKGKQHES